LRDAVAVDKTIPRVPLALWRSDAVVLFDWLMTVDLNTVPISHPAEKQALADLLTQLEQTDITAVTREEIDAARAEVAGDMGW
jgi:sulfur carrier protein ThiS